MSGQFEQSHDTNDREELEDICVLQMGRKSLQYQIHEEAQRGDVVDYIYRWGDELAFVRRWDETNLRSTVQNKISM